MGVEKGSDNKIKLGCSWGETPINSCQISGELSKSGKLSGLRKKGLILTLGKQPTVKLKAGLFSISELSLFSFCPIIPAPPQPINMGRGNFSKIKGINRE